MNPAALLFSTSSPLVACSICWRYCCRAIYGDAIRGITFKNVLLLILENKAALQSVYTDCMWPLFSRRNNYYKYKDTSNYFLLKYFSEILEAKMLFSQFKLTACGLCFQTSKGKSYFKGKRLLKQTIVFVILQFELRKPIIIVVGLQVELQI
ncbi:hypothetical protein HOY80DRAFT_1025010 [Tuber brumale]|nr:hypothetical protein HOY80DRAFT_1025010 [Tuber brumale]